MTTKRNGKLAPFKIGQKVHHIAADRIVRTVTWVSKGAETRGEQVIVTDYGVIVEADIYVEAA